MAETAPSATIRVPYTFTYRLALLDMFLRWAALVFYANEQIGSWTFWLLQAAAIPVVVLTVGVVREVRAKVSTSPQLDAAAVTLLVVMWVIGTYFSFSEVALQPEWLSNTISLVIALVYGFYLLVLSEASSGKPIEAERPAGPEHHDDNDRDIATLEAKRAALFQRVDTYTLEGTFLGAISFSAFVTIIADSDGSGGLASLRTALSSAVEALDYVPVAVVFNDQRTGTQVLLAALAAEALTCSVCFLSALIARIRFMYALSRADYNIRFASVMNAKEEDVLNLSLTATAETSAAIAERLAEIRENVRASVAHARGALRAVKPLVMYMSVFRNLGVIAFLSTLVTGAFWFAHGLAVAFATICLIAFSYPLLDKLRDRFYDIPFFRGHRENMPDSNSIV